MSDRDAMYGGFYQNMPGNMYYGNFGFQGIPGSNMLMHNQDNIISSSYFLDISNKINDLENRIKILEQKLSNSNSYQDDDSIYML